MKTMKTFNEFAQVNESKKTMEGKCMSESMMEKCNEMYESMCNEMKSCHEDATAMTAESYMSECSEKLNEIMESMKKVCEGCMAM